MCASASLCHCRAVKTVGILNLGNIGRAVAANLSDEGPGLYRCRVPSPGIAAPLIGPTLERYARLIEAGRGSDEGAAIYVLLKDARP